MPPNEPRFQSLYTPLVWVAADGVVSVDWSSSYQYSHDRELGKDYYPGSPPTKMSGGDPALHDRTLTEQIGNDWSDQSLEAEARRLRKLADALEARAAKQAFPPESSHG